MIKAVVLFSFLLSIPATHGMASINSATQNNNVSDLNINPLSNDNKIYVGYRRSSYGDLHRYSDNAWWAQQAIDFAEKLKQKGINATPIMIQIVSTEYQGNAAFEFAQPKNYRGSTVNMLFNPDNSLDEHPNHKKALDVYHEMGVKAIIQLESADANVIDALEVVHAKFKSHPAIIGYGIDNEWYRWQSYKDSTKLKTGEPMSNAVAKSIVDIVLSFNPNYTIFLKHWKPEHLPPTYRHNNLWFLFDGYGSNNLNEQINSFESWANRYEPTTVGFQFGYPPDQKWFKSLPHPMIDISITINEHIPTAKYLFWVDFTSLEGWD